MNNTHRRTAGSLLLVGAAQFIVAMVVAEAVYPGYSVSSNTISDLGVGSTALIFNLSVFLLGAAIFLSAFLIFRVFKNATIVALLVLAGVGAMGVGVFPKTMGYLHVVVSFVTFFFGGLSAIFAYKLEKHPLTYFSVVMGVFSLAALVLYGSQQYLVLGRGGMERMVAYPTLLWGIAFGSHLIGYPSKIVSDSGVMS